ncbi:proteasome non-ATPase 26S subunit, partial [Toxoplasma gondii ARI]
MLSAFDQSSQAAAPRVASLAALTAFVDSPQTSQALEEFRQHISPGELVLQTAQTAAQTAGRVKAELGENEESEELVIVVRALRKCLAYDGVLENVVREPQLRRVLIDAAESGSTLLRRLLVQQLGKLIGQGSAGVELAIEAKLYELLPGLLGDPDVGVASDAAKAIVASLESRQGCQAFSSPEFFQSLMAAAASPDEMVKVRTLALFVEAGRKNETVFNELADRGAFTVLVNSFATDDLLLKISLVALIEQ